MTLRFLNTYHPHHPPPYNCNSSNNILFTKLPSSLSLSFLPPIHYGVRRPRCPRMDFTITTTTTSSRRHRRKEKEKERVVVIMGATGTGKSQLSIDLATRFFPSSEIINSDKMQVYKGLDITTNKIPFHDRRGVPHHLLGEVDSSDDADFSPSDYRTVASSIISDITSRRKLPLLVGGSNSFIHALLADKFDPDSDPFNGSHSVSSELRYNCCFIWVDISLGVLTEYLSKRVDDMLESGMFDELSEFYDPEEHEEEEEEDDENESVCRRRTGIRKAIGVPEFDRYFRRYPPEEQRRRRRRCRRKNPRMFDTNPKEDVGVGVGVERRRRECYEEAVKAIKENTCQLAKRQIGKILRLRAAGWDLKRVDATEAFRAVMMSSDSGGGKKKKKKSSEDWEKQVVEPSVKIVNRFLDG